MALLLRTAAIYRKDEVKTMLFRHILVAYDGSGESDEALSYGIRLAQMLPETRIDVVHVFGMPNMVIGEAVLPVPSDVNRIEYEHAESIVERARRALPSSALGEAVLLQGPPAKVILGYADERACDLLILGSRGLSTMGEMMLGSVSHHVVQHAKIPVLIVK